MKTRTSLRNRQGGAVAVLVGISIFLLVGFLAMVIDLGHLYVAKTGLQNAADAAALSGAKELNGTQAGVDEALDRAKKTAEKNSFLGDFLGPIVGYQPVSLTEANIKFSNSPYTPDPDWISYTAARSAPGGLYFVKVDTGQQNLHTIFAVIWNIFNMSTYGRAVAGSFEMPIAPIGICALNTDLGPNDDGKIYVPDDSSGYLFEWGFQRGISYDFAKVNGWKMGLASGTELYLHPTATSVATCTPSGGNADFITPFLCTGKSAISGSNGSYVYANTGLAAGKAIAAINTRFDLYGTPLDPSLDHTLCPPDANIKHFGPSTAASPSGWMLDKDGNLFGGAGVQFTDPDDTAIIQKLSGWLADIPPDALGLRRTTDNFNLIRDAKKTKKADSGCGGNCSNNYGVLWSYTRPIDLRPATPRRPSASDWPALYGWPWPNASLPVGPTATTGYPNGTECEKDSKIWYRCPSPYNAGVTSKSGPYYQGPSHAGQRDRRVLNVVIVNCSSGGAGICAQLPVLGVGRFFMQTQADQARFIFGEFDGLLPQPVPPTQIRLY